MSLTGWTGLSFSADTPFRVYKAGHGPEQAREFRTRAADAGLAWVRHRLS
ncbi:hypothetical protein AB0M95_40970 [Sphaerisporangium sp. NPDC051017]